MGFEVHDNALEQAASAARPWQKAHRMLTGSGWAKAGPQVAAAHCGR